MLLASCRQKLRTHLNTHCALRNGVVMKELYSCVCDVSVCNSENENLSWIV